ncbi:hypothetical protein, partial [Nocardioides humilatus]|uniref:hypothetical protein n=1 Tax=Nocardioides humilatus TaxID=2607660 RepID=UPI001CB746A0
GYLLAAGLLRLLASRQGGIVSTAPAAPARPEPPAPGNTDAVHTGDSTTAPGSPGAARGATTQDFTQNAL